MTSARPCAQRDTNADLAGPTRDRVRRHAVNPDPREHQSDDSETARDRCGDALRRQAERDGVVERLRGHDGQVRIHRCQQRPEFVSDALPTGRARNNRHARHVLLLERDVHPGARQTIDEAAGLHVARHANHEQGPHGMCRPLRAPGRL